MNAKEQINQELYHSIQKRGNPLIFIKRLSLFSTFFSLLLCFSVITPTYAGQVSGWWGGAWTCNIDGRPARMEWRAVDDSETSCNGDVCSSTSGVRWQGSFSDNGSRWVPLTNPSKGRKGGLFFRHADGNQWYLSLPNGNKTTGWTTWNGTRYPLSCWR